MNERVTRWRPQAEKASSLVGGRVPVAFILAIIQAESDGTPSATRGEPHLDDASIGLMQLLVSTAEGLGYDGPVGEAKNLSGLYEPDLNVRLGTRLCDDLLRQVHSWENVASAYNGGIRLNLGFGGRYQGANPIRVCLERNADGSCKRWQDVAQGQFGNPQYVEKVMRYFAAFQAEPIALADPSPTPSPIPRDVPEPIDQGGQADGSGTPATGCAIVFLLPIAAVLSYLV